MACSKYASTNETTNAARLTRLLIDPCSDLLRDILRHHVPEAAFPAKLHSERLTIKPLLNPSQRALLYPKIPQYNFNYEDFDISLLYILLRNICGITQHSNGWGKPPDTYDNSLSANIDRIRITRNEYFGHVCKASLSDSDFQTVWSNIRKIIVELASFVGKTTYYEEIVDVLEHETMDPLQENTLLKAIDDQRKDEKGVRDELKDLSRLIAGIEKESRLDQDMKNLIENTKMILQNHKSSLIYKRTKVVGSVLEQLRKMNIVLLTGKPGEGKTTTAYEIMLQMSGGKDRRLPLIIDDPDRWNKYINTHNGMVVCLDDFGGKTNINSLELKKWKKILDTVFSVCMTGSIYLVICVRCSILKDVRRICFQHSLLKKDYEMDLASNELRLGESEKLEIINLYENQRQNNVLELEETNTSARENVRKDFTLSENEKRAILQKESNYGFPLLCSLFFSNKDWFELGTDFFDQPVHGITKEISKMQNSTNPFTKMQYCILVYTFLKGEFDDSELDECLYSVICKKVGLFAWENLDFSDAIEVLLEKYLTNIQDCNRYKFKHGTLDVGLLLSLSKFAVDLVLQNCTERTLFEFVKTGNYDSRKNDVVLKIERQHYHILSGRLLSQQTDVYHRATAIFAHSATDDPEFVRCIFEDLSHKSFDISRNVKTKLGISRKYELKEDKKELLEHLWDILVQEDKPSLVNEIIKRYGPFSKSWKRSLHCVVRLTKLGSCLRNTDVEETYTGHVNSEYKLSSYSNDEITQRNCSFTVADIKERLDAFIRWGCLKSVMSIIKNVKSQIDVQYFFGEYLLSSRKMSVLDCCIMRNWEDIIDVILRLHCPQTSNTLWSSVHYAVFFGRFSLLQKLNDLGHSLPKETSEGKKLLEIVCLGLRHADLSSAFYFDKDENESIFFSPFKNVVLIEEQYKLLIEHLMKNCSFSSDDTDFGMSIDRYNNNIIHYLVIYNRIKLYETITTKDVNVLFHRNDTKLPTTMHLAAYLGREDLAKKIWAANLRPREGDLSIPETVEYGRKFAGKIFLKKWYSDCWKDKYLNRVNGVVLKGIRDIQIQFGNDDNFDNILKTCGFPAKLNS